MGSAVHPSQCSTVHFQNEYGHTLILCQVIKPYFSAQKHLSWVHIIPREYLKAHIYQKHLAIKIWFIWQTNKIWIINYEARYFNYLVTIRINSHYNLANFSCYNSFSNYAYQHLSTLQYLYFYISTSFSYYIQSFNMKNIITQLFLLDGFCHHKSMSLERHTKNIDNEHFINILCYIFTNTMYIYFVSLFLVYKSWSESNVSLFLISSSYWSCTNLFLHNCKILLICLGCNVVLFLICLQQIFKESTTFASYGWLHKLSIVYEPSYNIFDISICKIKYLICQSILHKILHCHRYDIPV